MGRFFLFQAYFVKNIHKKIRYIKNIVYICIMYASELIKGTLKTIVLKLLTDNERMYGYEITQKVKESTSGKIQLTEGALYPTLHAMEKQGILSTEVENVGNRIRKYYKVTPTGKKLADDKVNEFSAFMETMMILLDIQPKLS